MKKILVTGCEGFLASRFIEYYKDTYEIIGINKKDLDITDENKVYKIFKENRFDLVLHSAAISNTDICEKNHKIANEINLNGTINIAKGCTLNNSTLIFASSDQIYAGNKEEGPYTEEVIKVPNNVYGFTKLNAENEIKNILDNYYNLRLTWMFSFPERNKKVNTNIITNILNAALKNKNISLSNNEFRGISYIYEVISNIEKLLNAPFGDYNFGSENNINTYELGKEVLNALGLLDRVDDIIIKDIERFKENKRDLRISNKKLRENNIYFSETDEAIKKCIKEFKF